MRVWNRESKLLMFTFDGAQATELDMSAFDLDFQVRTALPTKKDGKSHTELETCRVDIFKLKTDSRDRMSVDAKGVELWTGYDGDTSMIFRGPVINTVHTRENGLDWKSTIYAADAWDNFHNSFFSRSYSAGEPIRSIIDAVADSFSLSVTNEFTRTDSLIAGAVFFGNSKTILDKLAHDYDFSWSISAENGVHITDNLNPPLVDHTSVIILTSDFLISSPSIEESIENEGKKNETIVKRVHAACHLHPDLRAGSVVQFQPSSFIRDFASIETRALTRINPRAYYVVQECIHRGSTYADGDHTTEITTREET